MCIHAAHIRGSRTSDKAPSVRARALACFASLVQAVLAHATATTDKRSSHASAASSADRSAVDQAMLQQVAFHAAVATPGSVGGPEGGVTECSMLQIARHRAADAKAGVRRAAVAALTAIAQLPQYRFDRIDLKVSLRELVVI